MGSYDYQLLGKRNRLNAVMLGSANLITAITIEDFTWFVNRYTLPLENEPHGGQLMQISDWTSIHLGALDIGDFVIPYWYFIALALATFAYYSAFREHNRII